jgi:hypothetical protein
MPAFGASGDAAALRPLYETGTTKERPKPWSLESSAFRPERMSKVHYSGRSPHPLTGGGCFDPLISPFEAATGGRMPFRSLLDLLFPPLCHICKAAFLEQASSASSAGYLDASPSRSTAGGA